MRFTLITFFLLFQSNLYSQKIEYVITRRLDDLFDADSNEIAYCIGSTFNNIVFRKEDLMNFIPNDSILSLVRNKGKIVKKKKLNIKSCNCVVDSLRQWTKIIAHNDSIFQFLLARELEKTANSDFIELDSLEQIETLNSVNSEYTSVKFPYNGPYFIIELIALQEFGGNIYYANFSKTRIGRIRRPIYYAVFFKVTGNEIFLLDLTSGE